MQTHLQTIQVGRGPGADNVSHEVSEALTSLVSAYSQIQSGEASYAVTDRNIKLANSRFKESIEASPEGAEHAVHILSQLARNVTDIDTFQWTSCYPIHSLQHTLAANSSQRDSVVEALRQMPDDLQLHELVTRSIKNLKSEISLLDYNNQIKLIPDTMLIAALNDFLSPENDRASSTKEGNPPVIIFDSPYYAGYHFDNTKSITAKLEKMNRGEWDFEPIKLGIYTIFQQRPELISEQALGEAVARLSDDQPSSSHRSIKDVLIARCFIEFIGDKISNPDAVFNALRSDKAQALISTRYVLLTNFHQDLSRSFTLLSERFQDTLDPETVRQEAFNIFKGTGYEQRGV